MSRVRGCVCVWQETAALCLQRLAEQSAANRAESMRPQSTYAKPPNDRANVADLWGCSSRLVDAVTALGGPRKFVCWAPNRYAEPLSCCDSGGRCSSRSDIADARSLYGRLIKLLGVVHVDTNAHAAGAIAALAYGTARTDEQELIAKVAYPLHCRLHPSTAPPTQVLLLIAPDKTSHLMASRSLTGQMGGIRPLLALLDIGVKSPLAQRNAVHGAHTAFVEHTARQHA